MGWFSKLFGSTSSPPAVPASSKNAATRKKIARPRPYMPPGLRVVGRGGFPRAVVGESHHQDALNRICGGHNREGHWHECVARLVPEPENPHDENAVRVEIGGAKVGYLGREDAATYQAALSAAGHQGQPAFVQARIDGGWRRNQHAAGAGHFGVKLGLPYPVRFEV